MFTRDKMWWKNYYVDGWLLVKVGKYKEAEEENEVSIQVGSSIFEDWVQNSVQRLF